MSYNYLDIIIAIPLIWGCYIGFKKGLILELASLAALILGIYGALNFSEYTAEKLKSHIEISENWIGLLSYLITFLLIVIAIFMLAKVLDKMLRVIALGLVNRLLGLLFGFLKYTLIISVLIFIFNALNSRFNMVEEKIIEESLLFQPIQMVSKPLVPFVKEFTDENYNSDL